MSEFPGGYGWPYGFPYAPGDASSFAPPGIYAGSDLVFTKLFPRFPAGFWTLSYGLVLQAGQMAGPITFQSTQWQNTQLHYVDVPAALTAPWAPGKYSWQLYALGTALNTNPAANMYVSRGIVEIFQNLTIQAAVDSRGPWQKILALVEATIAGVAPDTQEQISIGRGTISGESLKGWPREDLIRFHDHALHMAGNETRIQNARGGGPNPRYKYATMIGDGNGIAFDGWPDFPPFS